jgi:uncharacterized protein YndB with AHSA1/START domain
MIADNGSKLTVTLPSDREIVLTRVFDAPRELVFDAFSQAEHMVHWLGPHGYSMPVCEVDLRPGGAWHFVHRDPSGAEFGFHGEMREIDRPRSLVRTFEYEGMPGHVSLETLRLDDLGDDRTRLTVTSLFDSVEDRDGMLRSGMERGATESYDRLAAYLPTLAVR